MMANLNGLILSDFVRQKVYGLTQIGYRIISILGSAVRECQDRYMGDPRRASDRIKT